jgi:serine/threonine protein phosphatase 1
MAIIAIGDIHGNLVALNDLLSQILSQVSKSDSIVFLGDYIDRGPNARGCIDRILEVKQMAPCSVVTLRGNHEDWMLRSFADHRCHSWIIGMEAFETVASYSVKAARMLREEVERLGPRLIFDKMPVPYDIFFDVVPKDHLDFFSKLQYFHVQESVICVHGGLDPHLEDFELQHPETLLWGGTGFPEEYSRSEKVIYGHWNNAVLDNSGWPSPIILSNGTYGIDTISHGILTAIRLPDERIFQSGQYL